MSRAKLGRKWSARRASEVARLSKMVADEFWAMRDELWRLEEREAELLAVVARVREILNRIDDYSLEGLSLVLEAALQEVSDG